MAARAITETSSHQPGGHVKNYFMTRSMSLAAALILLSTIYVPASGQSEVQAGPGGRQAADVSGPSKPAPRTADGHPDLNRRSEEHTSELQSHVNLVCRLLLEKKKKKQTNKKI